MGLEEADYSVTDMALGRNSQAGDENLLVRFYKHPMQDSAKTLEEGRPIFSEKDFIEIMIPGNKDSIIQRPASKLDINRFPRHWQAYQSRTSQDGMEGTPLEEWPGINRAQVEEFKFMNIRTVEQLATMSDANSQKFNGINSIRDKAKAYLESAKGNAASGALTEMKALLEAERAANAQMREDITNLQAALANAAIADTPKKRGRPPAAAEE